MKSLAESLLVDHNEIVRESIKLASKDEAYEYLVSEFGGDGPLRHGVLKYMKEDDFKGDFYGTIYELTPNHYVMGWMYEDYIEISLYGYKQRGKYKESLRFIKDFCTTNNLLAFIGDTSEYTSGNDCLIFIMKPGVTDTDHIYDSHKSSRDPHKTIILDRLEIAV